MNDFHSSTTRLAPVIFALLASQFLSSCGEKEATSPVSNPVEEKISAGKTEAPPPQTKVTLPPSGSITTSANTPTTPSTRLLTATEKKQVLNVMLNQLKDRQAAGLGGGTLHVNGAWHYDGYSYLSPNPASEIPARMVAIDVTVEGHTTDFDPDDIEILDGLTMVSYASDPHITFLKGPGEVIENPKDYPIAPAPTRMLLIYAFPKGSEKFTLFYWGKKLIPEPLTFEKSGWGLPYPEKAPPAEPKAPAPAGN